MTKQKHNLVLNVENVTVSESREPFDGQVPVDCYTEADVRKWMVANGLVGTVVCMRQACVVSRTKTETYRFD